MFTTKRCSFEGSERQTAHLPSKLTINRHILGMSTSLRDAFYRPKLFRLSYTPHGNKHPTQNTAPGVGLGDLQNPCAEIRKFPTGVRSGTPIHLSFKHGRNQCETSVVLVTEKHVLLTFGWIHGAIPPPKKNPQVRTVVPHLYSGIHPNPLRFGGLVTEKRFRNPKVNLIWASSSL